MTTATGAAADAGASPSAASGAAVGAALAAARTAPIPVGRWRLRLAYDGTDFAGWQRQPGREEAGYRTVQGEIETALSKVFRAEVTTVGTSRTDRGVHARAQSCHFDAPTLWGPQRAPGLTEEVALRRLRRELPGAVLAVALAQAAPGFHARLTAVRKRYSYRLALVDAVSPFEARFCWTCGPVDLEAMGAAAAALDGRLLDFSAFSLGEPEPDYHGSVEKLASVAVRADGPERALVFVSCDRFLYRMVRRIVGGLVEVGRGRLQAEALASAARGDIPTAPPEGLCLDEVEYPDEFASPDALLGVPPDLAPPPWP